MPTRIAPVSLGVQLAAGSNPATGSAQTARNAALRQRFDAFLDQIRTAADSQPAKPVTVYSVKRGDTLSGICRGALAQQGSNPTGAEIAQAVSKVARANAIANANVIQVGQSIDLASLGALDGQGGKATRLDGMLAKAASAQLKAKHDLGALIESLLPAAVKSAPTTETPWESVLDAPVKMTSGFGVRKDPITGAVEKHTGVDLAAPKGTTIHALKAGTVTFSGWQPSYGKVVIVTHDDGTETLYAHNAKNLVKAGDSVDAHAAIAQLGSTGRSTGPHLHFEVRRNGTAINPAPALEAASTVLAKT